MRKVFQKSFKKVLAIFLTLVLLFNAGGESFATIFDKQFVGQEKIISEIREVLQNAKIEDDPETKDYQACVDNKNEEKCTAYVTGIKEQFKQSAKQSQNPTTEDKKSYKTFEAAYKKAIEKEYKNEG